MKTPKKIWKITTACTLISEYTVTNEDYKSVKDIYADFDFSGDPKEVDYKNEDFENVEFSIDGGKTWEQTQYPSSDGSPCTSFIL